MTSSHATPREIHGPLRDCAYRNRVLTDAGVVNGAPEKHRGLKAEPSGHVVNRLALQEAPEALEPESTGVKCAWNRALIGWVY